MLIPLYVLVGVWGGPGRRQGDRDVRDLHDGRVAADARLDRRASASRRGRSPRDSGTSDNDWIFLGFVARVRGQGAALPVPRLAAAPRTARRRSRSRAVLSGVVSKAAVYGFICDRAPEVPGAGGRLARRRSSCSPRPALVYGSVLAFRAARRARGDRVLVDGADGPDHARHLRARTTRARRRGAAVREPRRSSRRRCSCSPGWSSARTRHRRVRAARRAWRRGGRVLATLVMVVGDVHARGPGLGELRGRVPDPDRRLRAGLGLRGGRRRRRSCSPRCTRCG